MKESTETTTNSIEKFIDLELLAQLKADLINFRAKQESTKQNLKAA